jgi:hypothetical protein
MAQAMDLCGVVDVAIDLVLFFSAPQESAFLVPGWFLPKWY